MTDCIIIGSGTAGISAALTLKANGKNFIIFGSASLSEKIEKAESIRNYPGLSNATGKAFVAALKTQLSDMEIAVTEEKVIGVYAMNDKFGVATQNGNYYESKAVILACGVESVKTIEGETEFAGRGVSFCATCDGALYKEKTIAVFCTSKRLEHEIEYLAGFAKKVYLIPMYKPVEIERENIEIVRKMPVKIAGETRVNKLIFKDGELKIDGLFSLRESVSPVTLVNDLKTEGGHVCVTRKMETNLKGLFAAGDCTGRPYQYAKAVGEGNVAAHAVSEYLMGEMMLNGKAQTGDLTFRFE
ncbi:MAG: NAD(P)/FAD-dependent oxidoreductase [Clostridia bacterium]|nr:NAD(P)/FAD-dependent oxidoreductase [Clostridia bacterium]